MAQCWKLRIRGTTKPTTTASTARLPTMKKRATTTSASGSASPNTSAFSAAQTASVRFICPLPLSSASIRCLCPMPLCVCLYPLPLSAAFVRLVPSVSCLCPLFLSAVSVRCCCPLVSVRCSCPPGSICSASLCARRRTRPLRARRFGRRPLQGVQGGGVDDPPSELAALCAGPFRGRSALSIEL